MRLNGKTVVVTGGNSGIGAAVVHVASVVLTATPDRDVAKGEEFGYFQFGGSDIILLFQAGVDPRIDTTEGFRHVGTPVARVGPR